MEIDPIFSEPRLAAVYDALDPDRSDLEAYLGIVTELGAGSVIDLGCGTGCLALLLAARGRDVVGVDPAVASLEVARAKPDASAVRWLRGDASMLPLLSADLVTMTGNAAQAIVDPARWSATLAAVFAALRPGGTFVFETREPSRQGWLEWTREQSFSSTDVDGVGMIDSWVELTDVALPLVSFRWAYVFPDGLELTSDSTLRFRDRAEVTADLSRHGYVLDDGRDAADRPGRELVSSPAARDGPGLAGGSAGLGQDDAGPRAPVWLRSHREACLAGGRELSVRVELRGISTFRSTCCGADYLAATRWEPRSSSRARRAAVG
jgi:SAM-dependent methyltransferase